MVKCVTGKIGLQKYVTHRFHSTQGSEVHNKAHLHYVLSCRAKHPIPLNHKRTWSCKYYQQTVLLRTGGHRLLLATGRTVDGEVVRHFPCKEPNTMIIIFASSIQATPNVIQSPPSYMTSNFETVLTLYDPCMEADY